MNNYKSGGKKLLCLLDEISSWTSKAAAPIKKKSISSSQGGNRAVQMTLVNDRVKRRTFGQVGSQESPPLAPTSWCPQPSMWVCAGYLLYSQDTRQ